MILHIAVSDSSRFSSWGYSRCRRRRRLFAVILISILPPTLQRQKKCPATVTATPHQSMTATVAYRVSQWFRLVRWHRQLRSCAESMLQGPPNSNWLLDRPCRTDHPSITIRRISVPVIYGLYLLTYRKVKSCLLNSLSQL